MKKMAIASCFVALCTASPFDHPLQRQARMLLARQGKTAQDPCVNFTPEQKGKCSYGKATKAMTDPEVMVCAMDMTKPGCAAKMDDITCLGIISQGCLDLPPDSVQCNADDVASFVEMMSKPCDKITDDAQKAKCTADMMGGISEDCLSCMGANAQREQKKMPQVNCWGAYSTRKECTWASSAKVWDGMTCKDEAACNQLKNSMTDADHVCLGCILSKMMGPKDKNGEPVETAMGCMSPAAMQTPPCDQNSIVASRGWGNCMETASDAKDTCEGAINPNDPDKDTKEEQCDAAEKAAQGTCKERFVTADASYQGTDKLKEDCSVCFMMSMGKADHCAPPDQRCTEADVPKVQTGYDCQDADCRKAASETLSGQCMLCQMQNVDKVKATCTLPLVKDTDGNDEPDYFKCIPQNDLCDVAIGTDGKVIYKATPKAPTNPPMSGGNPPTNPPAPTNPPTNKRQKYRKMRSLLKLAKQKVKQSMKDWCSDQAEPKRCKKIGKELANKVFKSLRKNLDALAVTSVVVTHLCKLVGAATEISNTDLADPAICAIVEEIADVATSSRAASILQAEGTLTAVYTLDANTDRTDTELTDAVDKAQADGELSVPDPVNPSEDLVTGGGGTTGKPVDLGPVDTPAPPSKKDDDDGSDIGMILGIIFGLLAAIGLVAVAAVFITSRKKAAQFGGAPAPAYHKAEMGKLTPGQ